MTYYKTFRGELPQVTGAYGHGNYDLSSLPVTLPALPGEPVLCEYGYHLCRRGDLVCHLSEHIAEITVSGGVLEASDKCVTTGPIIVVRLLERWTPRVQRLFASDCAERVLHVANNDACSQAVRVARLYALSLATTAELVAARDAARNAARNAARSAWDAARDASRDASRAAARNAARSAWDAAWSASRAAARSAAWDAARDASRAAARDAAWDAAWDAAREWQATRLFDWLEGRRTQEDVIAELEQEDAG
jgi:hypothetical protein